MEAAPPIRLSPCGPSVIDSSIPERPAAVAVDIRVRSTESSRAILTPCSTQ